MQVFKRYDEANRQQCEGSVVMDVIPCSLIMFFDDHNVARLLRIDEKSRDQIYPYLNRVKEGIWMR